MQNSERSRARARLSKLERVRLNCGQLSAANVKTKNMYNLVIVNNKV